MSKLRKLIMAVLIVTVAVASYMFLSDGEFPSMFIEPEETKLTAIKVTVEPTKVEYILGEKFDPTGMVVTATYTKGDGTTATEVIPNADLTISPATLTTGDTSVTIAYSENDVVAVTTQAVTVS